MSDSAALFEPTDYKYGFVTNVETESLPKGLNEEIIRAISAKKNEPAFLLEFRLKAYEKWLKSKEPDWANVNYPKINFQEITYYSAPKKKPLLNNLSEVDPEILRTFERLGIPVEEQKRLSNVAVDLVFDSVSIGTTFKKKLEDAGVVLCSISEAMHSHPELVRKYLGSVVPIGDNYYATLIFALTIKNLANLNEL